MTLRPSLSRRSKLDLVLARLAVQRDGLGGTFKRAPNLAACTVALWVSSARDPSRKAEIVLDPGGGAGLAAGCDCVDALNVGLEAA